MSLLQINLFGGVEVMRASGESVLIPSRKAATLLGYVALSSPRAISRGTIAPAPAFDRLCSYCGVNCRNIPM
jgi:DNA-binding SARP family transcriptional activator